MTAAPQVGWRKGSRVHSVHSSGGRDGESEGTVIAAPRVGQRRGSRVGSGAGEGEACENSIVLDECQVSGSRLAACA